MNGLRSGAIGILPPGALGVSLFHHLTAASTVLDGSVCFLERAGSRSGAALRKAGHLKLEFAGRVRELPLRELLLPDPVTAFQEGRLPEVLLVGTNPDQLLAVVTRFVALLETIAGTDRLDAGALPFPAVVLCANGIYHQRVRQLFVEKLEEATLYGRLPDLWPALMPAIVGRWLRGVSIQTGVRDGSGAESLYHPGPAGCTRIVGGLREVRARVVALCAGRGAWFEDGGDLSPTRAEFDKAIVNLASNLIGLLQAIDEAGRFRRSRVGELITPAVWPQLDELIAQVVRVGQAVKVYPADESLPAQRSRLQNTLELHRDHVPSSVQWVDVELRRRRLQAQVTPTERWLLEPLVRYAEAAHLPDTADYFRSLEQRLVDKLKLAIRGHEDSSCAVPRPC